MSPRRPSPANLAGRAGTAPGPSRAFTLLETLVAIGAVALISLGLARIFGATSETLRAGRRVSHFNDYARSLERTMRRDFEKITRDGFLVIANELTDQPVASFNGDLNARRRRIDQIMFFASGQFRTQRTPIYPSRIASGAQAAIYYGHGLRQEPGSPAISVPPLDDRNRDGGNSDSGQVMDVAPAFGRLGPNEFCGDWLLLRHVSVLTQPKAKASPRPNNITFPTVQQWEDNDIQVDLAPAQSSLFRNLARGTPQMLPATNLIARPGDAVCRPLLSSGLVDVITTDLAEVRSIILDAQPINPTNPAEQFDPTDDDNSDFYINTVGARVQVPYAFQPDLTADGSNACAAMKQWMLQALPAEPRQQTTTGSVRPPQPFPDASPDFGGRMRAEIAPPDPIGTLANNGAVYAGPEEYRRSDQTMLASSTFAVSCTEFIVEWSFGETYLSDYQPNLPGRTPDPFLSGAGDPRVDQIIWHGLERLAETDFASGLDPRADRVAGPYLGRPDANPLPGASTDSPIDAHFTPVRLTDGRIEAWRVRPQVIHEPVNRDGFPEPQDGEPFYSIFGYVDPTFPGPLPAVNATSPTDFRQFRPDTIPCAWPRLIRITMTLADPADPGFQQTYQFVLEVPDDRRNGD